jgi:hypothetical protein
MLREPKRRDHPKWDGMVVLGCHGTLGRGRDNGRDRSAEEMMQETIDEFERSGTGRA